MIIVYYCFLIIIVHLIDLGYLNYYTFLKHRVDAGRGTHINKDKYFVMHNISRFTYFLHIYEYISIYIYIFPSSVLQLKFNKNNSICLI